MKAHIHRATWETWQAKAASIATAVALAAPSMAPKGLAAWLADQLPFIPPDASYAVALAIVATRLLIAAKAKP